LLIEQLGLEGYGIYWILVETLRDQPEYKYPLALLPALARRFNTTTEKITTVVMKYGLFDVVDDEFFFSDSLIRRMLPLTEKRDKMRANALKRWHNDDAKAMQLQCNGNPIAMQVKESKVKQSIEKDITPIAPKGAERSSYASRFVLFWQAYPKKTGKGAAEKSFSRQKVDDTLLDIILKAIEIQKQSEQWQKNGGQFIPNPATWLNQKRWEDETPPPSNTTGNIFADMLREKQDERN
jgi:hypothetical protein